MPHSLLAYLYPHIRGSQEDVATLSLCYLLQQSDSLRVEFTRFIGEKLHVTLDEKTQYHTQATGKNKERPDLAGTASDGSENVLCEMKFYAALTDNQPHAYLNRLIANQGKGLLFICPKARQIGLWQQLLDLCKSREIGHIDDTSAFIDGMPMAISNWIEILGILYRTASDKDPSILDDLHELQGFCQRMDSDEPLPFSPEDFSISLVKALNRYSEIIDMTLSHFMSHNEFNPSTKGARATPQKSGYSRYFTTDSLGIDLRYDRFLWGESKAIETPFWVRFSRRNPDRSSYTRIEKELLSLPEKLKLYRNYGTYLALIPKPYVPMDEVAADLCEQIIWYINYLNSQD